MREATSFLENAPGPIPAAASGGIVRRPTLALVGEAGPEAIVPLSGTPGNSALPGGMTVNIQGDVFAQDGYAFADKVTEALRRRGLVAVA